MIEAHDLCMLYGNTVALDKVSFSVTRGEVVGLLGPNGAGKTTIMKILATQIVPSGGTARVAGFDVTANSSEVRASLGYLPEQAPLYDEMEVREYLDFVGRARGLSGSLLKNRLEWVACNCGLQKMWCRPLRELSKGYRQRAGLAQALIHDPPVLILDEPTSGLDPLQIMEIRSLVRTLSREKAVLFSTHILQEITAVSDRILVINNGRLRAQGRLADLSDQVKRHDSIRLLIKSETDIGQELKKLPGVNMVHHLEISEVGCRGYRIEGNKKAGILDSLAVMLKGKDILVKELYPEPENLEEVFMSLISKRENSDNDSLS